MAHRAWHMGGHHQGSLPYAAVWRDVDDDATPATDLGGFASCRRPKSPLIRKKQKAPLLGKKKAHDPKGSPQILFGQYFCKSDFGEWLGYFHVFA